MSSDDATQQLTVTGHIKTILFESPTSFFKIAIITIDEASFAWPENEIAITGSFAELIPGGAYRFTGELVTHPKYGQQFAALSYEATKPDNEQGLVAYLSSDEFPGIGKKTATKIVDALGLTAIDQILEDAEILKPLGINAAKRAMIGETLMRNQGMAQVIVGLNDFGLSANMVAKVYDLYGQNAVGMIQENPYRLIGAVPGIGFKRADAIASRLGIEAEDPLRLRGALVDALAELTDGNGDTYATSRELLNATLETLETARPQAIEPDDLVSALDVLVKQGDVVVDDTRIFPARLFEAEKLIADRIRLLTQTDWTPPDRERIKKALRQVEKRLKIQYDETQQAAIFAAIENPVFLLTGGPGTGKTTVINGVVRVFALLNELSLDANLYEEGMMPLMLAAPTGRASKRLMSATQLPAGTIHRLLGMGIDTTDYELKDLPDGLLIIDEMSMVDTYLFKQLLLAVHPGIQLLLVGDKDQLPSVGPGQVFADLLHSACLPAAELTAIHRQEEGSSIIDLAHAINTGVLPPDWQEPRPDRSFILCPPEQLTKVTGQVIARAAQRFDSANIQVLAPMYRGAGGVDELNPLLQDVLNPKRSERTKEVTFGEMHYRIGDKVLHLVNDTEAQVFNGELGIITGIALAKTTMSKSDELTIDFDGQEVRLKRAEWTRITLAYATTIHKAQGSEFDVVVLPLALSARRMLQRNLLYTAVTRAKQFLILLGDPRAFAVAAQTVADNRQTRLVQRLQTVLPHLDAGDKVKENNNINKPEDAATNDDAPAASVTIRDYRLTPELVRSGAIDPMIGLEGVTLGETKTKE